MADPTDRIPVVTVSTQQFVIALIVAGLVGGVVGVLAFVSIPDRNATVLNVVVGNIMGFMAAALAFYFPSSVGARAKDEAISKLVDQAGKNGDKP